jgi:hypothetical protein
MSSRFVKISSRSQVRETIEEISEPCKTGMIDRTALGRVADPAYEYSTAKNTACSDPQLSGSQNPCQSDRKSSSLVRYRCLNTIVRILAFRFFLQRLLTGISCP